MKCATTNTKTKAPP